ncbi:hypothetical protein J8J14_18560 [Roseomonas sp. SSH11]|uniref:Uncharacterized protein n=1 Tax=Pararoseomonas baculiformis TaxID=2820812 RepID=A0ABS4AIC3_9PROT|nr:hypothetical protein [Pararoseomonas baculiformis]MBP0446782.1 hypothetical protein [Pararoseomonas baculiformis]
MGRLQSIFSPMGLVILAFLLLVAVLTLARRRMVSRSGSMDMLGMDGEGEAAGRDGPIHMAVHPDFRSLLDHVVLPRREAHPDWERLDGAWGVPGKPIARFDRNGMAYAVNGETSFAALEALDDWMRAHPGEDPFVVIPGKGPKGRLGARPEIGWTDQKALRIETD